MSEHGAILVFGGTGHYGRNIVTWSSRHKASSYAVELSADPSFNSSARPEISTATTHLNVTIEADPPLDPRTYYWRVRADVTDPTQPLPVRSFSVMDNAIYVYCAAGQVCVSEALVGNLSTPHQNVNTAIIDAAANGVREVRVAARGSDEGYRGAVMLLPGISLSGGYNSGFSSQDPATLTQLLLPRTSRAAPAQAVVPLLVPKPRQLGMLERMRIELRWGG